MGPGLCVYAIAIALATPPLDRDCAHWLFRRLREHAADDLFHDDTISGHETSERRAIMTAMQILFYVSLAGVFFILMMGIINLVRTDPEQASRSNKLMRMRVAAQAVVIAIVVIIGWMMGAFN